MSHDSLYGSAQSSFPSQTQDLGSLLVKAKEHLQHAQDVASDAQHLVHDALSVSHELASLRCDVRFIEELVESQAKVVRTFREVLKEKHTVMESSIKAAISQARTTSQKLESTLDGLSSTTVDESLTTHLERSHSHESLFGSQGSVSSHTARTRRRSADLSRTKTLRDFVDEHSLDLVLESGSEDRNALEDILAHHANLLNLLSQPPETPEMDAKGSTDVAQVVKEIISTLVPPSNDSDGGMLSEMARELESLGVYYESLTEAVQTSHGPHGLSKEELEVFQKDSEEVPNIIGDLEHGHASISGFHNELTASLASVKKHMQALEVVVSQLDAIGLEMADITAVETQLAEQVPARLEGLKAHQDALVELDAYYLRYTEAYAALVQEMERRNSWFLAVDGIVEETRRKLELLREDEFGARSDFVQEHGEFLPDDLCPTIADGPPDVDRLLIP